MEMAPAGGKPQAQLQVSSEPEPIGAFFLRSLSWWMEAEARFLEQNDS